MLLCRGAAQELVERLFYLRTFVALACTCPNNVFQERLQLLKERTSTFHPIRDGDPFDTPPIIRAFENQWYFEIQVWEKTHVSLTYNTRPLFLQTAVTHGDLRTIQWIMERLPLKITSYNAYAYAVSAFSRKNNGILLYCLKIYPEILNSVVDYVCSFHQDSFYERLKYVVRVTGVVRSFAMFSYEAGIKHMFATAIEYALKHNVVDTGHASATFLSIRRDCDVEVAKAFINNGMLFPEVIRDIAMDPHNISDPEVVALCQEHWGLLSKQNDK
jgi:hypothetical protein